MTSPWVAALVALFLWWFSTGAILARVRLADRAGRAAHGRSVLYALPLLVLGLWGLLVSAGGDTAGAVYAAFASALLVWGWVELAFLSGAITGPNRRVCPEGAPEWQRFLRAWGTIAYHELALLAVLTFLAWQVADAPNPFGLWVFVLLFVARISAKLNLYYGVPRIHTEFLPAPLSHLPSHFRRRTMNPVFPLSAIGLSALTAAFLGRMAAASGPPETVGYALLAAIAFLALAEHLFMVLPVADQKLWRWMLPAPKPKTETV